MRGSGKPTETFLLVFHRKETKEHVSKAESFANLRHPVRQ